MKPTKNRVFCLDSKRYKMVFETEKKALTFIKFNKDEILNNNSYAPSRAYFCIACSSYHVTSKEVAWNIKSHTEIILEKYQATLEKATIIKQEKNKEIKADGKQLFLDIQRKIRVLRKLIENNENCESQYEEIKEKVAQAKNIKIKGGTKKIINIEKVLSMLKKNF
jgi:hypothetical protein